MSAFALRSLAARRGRAAMTVLAVLLGVSMISGTLVFTDTIDAAFRELFTSSTKGAQAIVSSRQDITAASSAPVSVPVSLVRALRGLPGVAAVQGQISDRATIVGRNGRVIQSQGSPPIAISYLPAPFGGLSFVRGRRPQGQGEVALDQGTAEAQGYRVGDSVPIGTGEPVRRFRITGIVRLGGASLGGSTFAVFSLSAARQLYGKRGKVDIVYVAGTPGTRPETLVNEIGPLLSHELVVRTAQGQVDNDVKRLGGQLGLLTDGLLAFGFIAVLVGGFVIFNTFSITVAQRAREFALLRAIGASARQILQAVVIEATAIGVVASLAGLAAGFLAATGIRALFRAVHLNLPSTTLVLAPRTALVGVLVGILVTVAAGLIPALRATRVAPLEALREGAVQASPDGLRARLTAALAALLAIAGILLVLTSSGTTGQRLGQSAAGAVAIVLAILILSPRFVVPLSRVAGWPLARGRRILGRLAQENAARNPARTAVSASSLMIGLALVLFVTVYASGVRASAGRIIDRTFLGDFTIESQDGTSSIPAASARVLAVVPDVLAVSSLKTASARLGRTRRVTAVGIEPATIGQVYRFDWINGSAATLNDLVPGDAIVERDTAIAAHLHVGERVVLGSETGRRAALTVRGIYRDQALLRGVALPRVAFDTIFHQQRLQEVFVKLTPGADRGTAAAGLSQALGAFPGVQARSERELKDEVSGRVDSVLVLFYALLAMSVLVSLLGIVNTLTLSVHERTRELGMLRAVGMTQGQARVLIRSESVITAAIGSLVGVLVGLLLAWIVTRALSDEGLVFSLPWAQVGALLALGLLAGALAAVGPARRAARLDVLAAIGHE